MAPGLPGLPGVARALELGRGELAMMIAGATRGDLLAAAETVGVNVELEDRATGRSPRRFKVRLTPQGDRRRAVSPRGRRLNSVSWAGHRDFFRALYARVPAADVHSTFYADTRYRGVEEFERRFPDTGNLNIGSRAWPMCWADNEYDEEGS